VKVSPEKRGKNRLSDLIQDRFSDTWKLLSDTTNFLSRTPEFAAYEGQLYDWRQRLSHGRTNQAETKAVHTELTALRRSLRLQGYDLALGSQNLVFDGFHDDSCLADGFTRLVLFLGEDDLYYLTGAENHVTLSAYLEKQLAMLPRPVKIRGKHYLWYKRAGNDLILAGSATELKEDFARLEKIGAANVLLFLSKLKKLR
jgi:hypothetical protein